MKLLEKKRDELAKEYSLAKYPVQNIETRKDFTQDVNFARRMSHCQTFQDGFDAALKELEPMIKGVVDVLEEILFHETKYIESSPAETTYYADQIKQVLEKYKQMMGE